jgi:hypothetical protein
LLLWLVVLISRCVWHPRNYGHGKLLGVSRWGGRGLGFVDGLCDRCAQRIHPEVRPRVTRGGIIPRRGCTLGIVAAALCVVMALILTARPTSDLSFRHVPPGGVVRLPEETLAPPATSFQAGPPLHQPPSSQAVSTPLRRPARLTSAAYRVSPGSRPRVSRARASRPAETSKFATGRIFYQSP